MTIFLGYLHTDRMSTSFVNSRDAMLDYDASGPRLFAGYAAVQAQAGGIPEARNQIAGQFLESNCDWLLFVDSDMGFAPDTAQRLLEVADPADRPIVGGLTFAQRLGQSDGMGGHSTHPQPVIMDWIEHDDGVSRFTGRKHYPANSLIRCGATGAAMLLIHRSVIETIQDKYGPNWFTRVTTGDGVLGEDISFFVRVNAVPFPVYVFTGVRTTHHKSLWLGESDFWAWFTPPPADQSVSVIVPTIEGRPGNVERLAKSLIASTGLADLTVVADVNQVVDNLPVNARVVYFDGTFAEKVNHVWPLTTGDWIMLAGDDVVFHAGWWDHAQFTVDTTGADVIGTNDLANSRVMAGEHATHPILRREYVETEGASWDGELCHEGYRHWFVDDEIVTKAKLAGRFAPSLGSKVEHLHPIVGKADLDDVYTKGAASKDADAKLFRTRLHKYASASVPVG